MRITGLFFIAFMLVFGFPNEILAKPPSKDMYARAKGLYDAKRYTEAAAALGELYLSDPDPWLLQKQALCFESMGQWEDALDAYAKIVKNHPNMEEKLRVLVVQAQNRIENLLERPVGISIVASVPGASVRIEDKVGESPFLVELKRGIYAADISAPGYHTARIEFNAQSQGQVVTASLTPILVEIVLNHGSFDGDVTVTLDGQVPAGLVQQSDRVVRFIAAPGERRVTCQDRVGRRVDLVLKLQDSDATVNARCEPPHRHESWPAWVVLGSGVAALAVGTGLGIDAIVKQAEADSSSRKHCEGCSAQQIVGWTVAGVGAAAVITSIFLFPDDEEALAWLPIPIPQATQPAPMWVWTSDF